MASFMWILAVLLLASSPSSLAFERNEYLDALTKSILFYEGMRSGKLPPNQRLTWRGDSGLRDGQGQHVDLTGGYYDSGDNVKFGLPMAFTATLLSWSAIEYKRELQKSGELQNTREAIRWVTDYLLKAYQPPYTLWVQVGDPYTDHRCWQRPEDMDTPRNAYQVNAQKPGSDVAAETAAALAAASIVFKKSDPDYSRKLLSTAQQVFEFADKFRGSYSDVLASVVSPFYKSFSGYKDELLWGALWMHKATNDPTYVDYVMKHEYGYPGTNPLSWDNKYAGVNILMSKMFLETKQEQLQVYKTRADEFICSVMPGKARMTPAGLYYYGANNLQYVTSNAFLLLTYANYLNGAQVSCGDSNGFTSDQLIAHARQQIDYILGDNPNQMSYMVGFGNRFPLHVHHRAASLPSMTVDKEHIACVDGFNWLHNDKPNLNLLLGALPGGPNETDKFSDDRDNPSQTEASTYTNSGLVGVLAYLSQA